MVGPIGTNLFKLNEMHTNQDPDTDFQVRYIISQVINRFNGAIPLNDLPSVKLSTFINIRSNTNHSSISVDESRR